MGIKSASTLLLRVISIAVVFGGCLFAGIARADHAPAGDNPPAAKPDAQLENARWAIRQLISAEASYWASRTRCYIDLNQLEAIGFLDENYYAALAELGPEATVQLVLANDGQSYYVRLRIGETVVTGTELGDIYDFRPASTAGDLPDLAKLKRLAGEYVAAQAVHYAHYGQYGILSDLRNGYLPPTFSPVWGNYQTMLENGAEFRVVERRASDAEDAGITGYTIWLAAGDALVSSDETGLIQEWGDREAEDARAGYDLVTVEHGWAAVYSLIAAEGMYYTEHGEYAPLAVLENAGGLVAEHIADYHEAVAAMEGSHQAQLLVAEGGQAFYVRIRCGRIVVAGYECGGIEQFYPYENVARLPDPAGLVSMAEEYVAAQAAYYAEYGEYNTRDVLVGKYLSSRFVGTTDAGIIMLNNGVEFQQLMFGIWPDGEPKFTGYTVWLAAGDSLVMVDQTGVVREWGE